MSRRIVYRGRDHYVSNGRTAGHGMPLAIDRTLSWSTRASLAVALGSILYFAAEFLR